MCPAASSALPFVGEDDSVRPVKALHPVGRDPCVPPPRQRVSAAIRRGGRLCPPRKTPHPVGRDPCVPPPRQHVSAAIRRGGRRCPPRKNVAPCRAGPVCPAASSALPFVGEDDSVRPVKALHPVGRDPCVPPPRQRVSAAIRRGGRLCPPRKSAAPCRAGPMCPAAGSCHSQPVTVSLAWESVLRAHGAVLH